MRILAIESSCDETSVAIIENSKVLSNVISSQEIHSKYGGVIPELASREHLAKIDFITKKALAEADVKMSSIDAIAATASPGLVGSLLVGVSYAKGLAIKFDLPVVPINHIEGHIYSAMLDNENLSFPYAALVVSGGHTAIFFVESFNKLEIVGSTIDDAAGEAFDKIAASLGLPYPGGPEIDKLAKKGDPKAFDFPRALRNSDDFNFSFSGLKTSVRRFLKKNFPEGVPQSVLPDIAASVQAAITDSLVEKTIAAALEKNVSFISVSGGVSANSALRKAFEEKTRQKGLKFYAPNLKLCMDNAAMIGFLAENKYKENFAKFRDLTFTVSPKPIRGKIKR